MGSLESLKNPNPMAQTMSIMLNVYGQNLRGCKPSDSDNSFICTHYVVSAGVHWTVSMLKSYWGVCNHFKGGFPVSVPSVLLGPVFTQGKKKCH